jgi:zinc/manganese transport system substrate-binding protein
MKKWYQILLGLVLITSLLLTSCRGTDTLETKKSIVVTYSVLGSVVSELDGDAADVTVSIPNGLDLHGWEPSAKDIEAINNADLVIVNGLDLEEGMENALEQAEASGVKIFTASDYIAIRYVAEGELAEEEHEHETEEEEEEHHHHEAGSADPHLWTDPLNMKAVVAALADYLKTNLDMDVDAQSADLQQRLDDLNTQIEAEVAELPLDSRKLVTGHASMGYFAQRYGFTVIGAIIPSLSAQASVSAGELADLKQVILENNVKAIFAEVGTSPDVADAIATETGAKVVELAVHMLPSDGSYFTFETELAKVIVEALK